MHCGGCAESVASLLNENLPQGDIWLSTTCVHRVFNISLLTCFPPGPANRHICNLNNLLQKRKKKFRLCCFRCRFRSGFKSQKNKGLQLKPFHFWHNIHPQKWAHYIVQHKVPASRNSADTERWLHQKLQQDEGEKTVRLQTSFVKACLSVWRSKVAIQEVPNDLHFKRVL